MKFFSMPRNRLLAIFALAFVARLIFAVQWHALPYGPDPLLDAKFYHEWAQRIAQGHIAHPRAFYMMPLYPYALGLIYAIFGHSLWVASLFNALLDSATCAVLAELGFLAFGAEAGVATGILAALYRALIFYTPMVMKESLGIFLLALFALLAFRALREKDKRVFLWSGLCLGLGVLVRGNVLALAAVMFAFIYLSEKPALARKSALLFAAGLAIAILPVTLHNAIASGDFVLTSYAGGFNFYVGNGPEATGRTYEFPREVTSNPDTEEVSAARVADVAEGRRLKPSEVSAWWRGRTVDYMLANPGHEALLLLNKLEAFWSNDEPYDNYDMNFIARHFGTLLAAPLVDFGIVAALALFAVIVLAKKKRDEIAFFGAMTGVYMLTLLLFYVTDRYRLSVVVFLLPLAGAAVPAACEALRAKKRQRYIIAAIAALVPLATAFMPSEVEANIEAFDWGKLTAVYEDDGQPIAAVIAFNQALAIDAPVVGSEAWVKSADALDQLGHHPEAEVALKKTEAVFPREGTAAYDVGRMAYMDGDYPAAAAEFKKAIALAPSFGLAWRGLAAVYNQYGDTARAIETIHQGLNEDPDDPVLLDVRDGFGG